jgi:hypothetical protein
MSKTEEAFVTFALLSIPFLQELILDYIRIVRKKKEDDHATDTPIRGAIILVMAIVNWKVTGHSVWQSALLGVALFWLIFDYALNILRKQKFFFLGKSSWFDRKLSNLHPLMILFLKVFLFAFALLVYYNLDQILQ